MKMKGKTRYIFLICGIPILLFYHYLLCYINKAWTDNLRHPKWKWRHELPRGLDSSYISSISRRKLIENFDHKNCRMDTCFDYNKCKKGFKVYIYPPDPFGGQSNPSESYEKILNHVKELSYYTSDPDEACLFLLSLDTLDRDELSTQDYVPNLQSKISRLTTWNEGQNHVIFNLYAGTYKYYNETDLGFDPGKAILAKASMSDGIYRPHFDVSIPLFHRSHPERGGQPGAVSSNIFPVSARHKHLVSFKGKRYVYGTGSDTRNTLHHLHNGKDVVLATTCKHGQDWKKFQDERCSEDNKEYERWDYDSLLQNSTFCLVPRGRRLGSFRFIETLKAGCVPVLLSNGWRLPFAEVIDWSQAVIQADERLLLQVPEMLHSVSPARIFSMRQQTQMLWSRYLSSVDKIVDTTFEIIRERIYPHKSAREGIIWNSNPGALLARPGFSDSYQNFPFDFTPKSLVQSGLSNSENRINNIEMQRNRLNCPPNTKGCENNPSRQYNYPLSHDIIQQGDNEDNSDNMPLSQKQFGEIGVVSSFSLAKEHRKLLGVLKPSLLGDKVLSGHQSMSSLTSTIVKEGKSWNSTFKDNSDSTSKFTAVIYTQLSAASPVVHYNAPVFKLVSNVAASEKVDRIIVYWASPINPPPTSKWPYLSKMQSRALNSKSTRKMPPIHVITNDDQSGDDDTVSKDARKQRMTLSSRFLPSPLIKTQAILSLDDDAAITTEEIDFAFGVWKHFPDRIVGYPARSHYYDERKSKQRWVYTSKWSNEYSMVLTGAAFYHKYYNYLYTEWLSPLLLKTVDQAENCEDILMNFLVSHVTQKPPIKVTQRKQYKEKPPTGVRSPWSDPEHFRERQTCMNTFAAIFGYMPLKKSATRFDPVLFKDQVSNTRKKYRKLELIPIASGAAIGNLNR